MSDPDASASPATPAAPAPLGYQPPPHDLSSTGGWQRHGVFTRLGGGIGLLGCVIGLGVLLAACAGYEGSLRLSTIIFLLGGAGLLFSILGGLIERNALAEDTHVLAALFASSLSIIGGLVLAVAQHGWKVFP